MSSPRETAGAAASGPIPSLDGIRALAVGLVFFAHSGLEKILPGGLGVTVFFVLSGYLITTLLRQEHARGGSVSLRNFYLRRCLRLMPPLLVTVVAGALLAATGLIAGGFSRHGLLAVLFYFGNYFVIAHDFQGLPDGAGVIWSLAVEEHYYLVYPPLALLLLRLNRPRRSALLLGGACAAVLARRLWLAGHGGGEAYIGMATDTRIDAILVGCLLGWLQNPWLERGAPQPSHPALLALLCGGLLATSLLYRDEQFRLTLRYTVQSLAVAPLLYLAVSYARTRACRWLQAPVLVYLGQVSYSVYLSHHLLLQLVFRQWPQLGWIADMLLAAALTLLYAEALRRWVERPCAALRGSLRRATTAQPPVPASTLGTPA
ncbi:MAG: acyltransferase [Nevskia sp.]|nr:acyltransferase [Nevskia sp.]